MATAKKVAAKKTAPKKVPVKKATVKKAAAKSAPMKKAAVKKAPAQTSPPQPAPKQQAAPSKPATPIEQRHEKPKKPKLVRDSFTIPKSEYAVLDELKQRAAMSGVSVKKSELLRAGIKALAAMSDLELAAAMNAVPAIKTGRPAKD